MEIALEKRFIELKISILLNWKMLLKSVEKITIMYIQLVFYDSVLYNLGTLRVWWNVKLNLSFETLIESETENLK